MNEQPLESPVNKAESMSQIQSLANRVLSGEIQPTTLVMFVEASKFYTRQEKDMLYKNLGIDPDQECAQ